MFLYGSCICLNGFKENHFNWKIYQQSENIYMYYIYIYIYISAGHFIMFITQAPIQQDVMIWLHTLIEFNKEPAKNEIRSKIKKTHTVRGKFNFWVYFEYLVLMKLKKNLTHIQGLIYAGVLNRRTYRNKGALDKICRRTNIRTPVVHLIYCDK